MQVSKLILALLIMLLCFFPALAQDTPSEDIEATRSEMLKRWGVDGLVKPSDVEANAKKIRNYLGRLSTARPARAIWMATSGLYPWFAMDWR